MEHNRMMSCRIGFKQCRLTISIGWCVTKLVCICMVLLVHTKTHQVNAFSIGVMPVVGDGSIMTCIRAIRRDATEFKLVPSNNHHHHKNGRHQDCRRRRHCGRLKYSHLFQSSLSESRTATTKPNKASSSTISTPLSSQQQLLGQRRQPVSSFDLASSVTTSLVDIRDSIAHKTTISSSSSSPFVVTKEEVNGVAPQSEEYKRGMVTIGAITLLFASNSPVMHAALQSSSIMEQPPPVLLINAGVSVVAFLGLLLSGPLLESTIPPPSSLSIASSTVAFDNEEQNEATNKDDGAVSLSKSLGVSTATRAGVELGLLKFLGTTANLYGLSLTTSDHGAFLIQLTTLIVPVVQGLMGVPIPNRLKQSIGLALAGVLLFTQEGSTTAAMSSSSLDATSTVAVGDAFCVLAAGFYAAYDLRLYKWGKLVSPRQLIIRKIATQACFSVALLLAVQSNEAASFLSNHFTMETGMGLGVLVLWSGLAVNMLAPFLQVGGQQAVGPTRAQTLYASQPLWAAMMAFVFQGETVGVQGMVGGGAFLSALFLAATAEQAPSSPAEPILPSSPNHTTPTNTFQSSVPKQ